jgi:hypothetical protein
MSILILKNATIAQLYPAKVEKNVDIVIENDEIIATGSCLASATHRPPSKRCMVGW